MMAIFGREIIGLEVLDRAGVLLGNLVDLQVDLKTGGLNELLVEVEATVPASGLPFESEGSLVKIPSTAVARIGAKIHLNQ